MSDTEISIKKEEMFPEQQHCGCFSRWGGTISLNGIAATFKRSNQTYSKKLFPCLTSGVL